MTVPYWIDDPEAWNTCQLGDVYLPGVVTVELDDISRDVDVKKTKGSDGATMTDNGRDPAKLTIKCNLVNRSHWEHWQSVRNKIDPRKAGGPREPKEIVHPLAALAGVKNIYVQSVHEPSPTARGGMLVTLKCLEWFPAPKPIKKAAGKKNANGVLTPSQAAESYYPQRRSALRVADPSFQPTGADALDRAFGFGEGV